jgi:hypothetical protein
MFDQIFHVQRARTGAGIDLRQQTLNAPINEIHVFGTAESELGFAFFHCVADAAVSI